MLQAFQKSIGHMPALLPMLGTFMGYKIPEADKPPKARETVEQAAERLVGKLMGGPRVTRRS